MIDAGADRRMMSSDNRARVFPCPAVSVLVGSWCSHPSHLQSLNSLIGNDLDAHLLFQPGICFVGNLWWCVESMIVRTAIPVVGLNVHLIVVIEDELVVGMPGCQCLC